VSAFQWVGLFDHGQLPGDLLVSAPQRV
jgi:hypothetical protein